MPNWASPYMISMLLKQRVQVTVNKTTGCKDLFKFLKSFIGL